jgi:hypothetical protein
MNNHKFEQDIMMLTQSNAKRRKEFADVSDCAFRNSGFLKILMGLELALGGVMASAQALDEQVLYSTAFEEFDFDFTLVGQGNWLGDGIGGNGFTSGFIDADGAEAFIGFVEPIEAESFVSAWRPTPFDPIQAGKPIILFQTSVLFGDSTNEKFDTFRWSVYNQESIRLFSLVFDNSSLLISSLPDENGLGLVESGFAFEHNVTYELEIEMNFQANLWSARMNGDLIISSQQITTLGLDLKLGDVGVEWLFADLNLPGDNFMIFDDYKIAARALPPPVGPTLTPIAQLPNGQFLLRLDGTPGATYAIEFTEDFGSWTELSRREASQGVFEFLDTGASGSGQRFYRAVLVE